MHGCPKEYKIWETVSLVYDIVYNNCSMIMHACIDSKTLPVYYVLNTFPRSSKKLIVDNHLISKISFAYVHVHYIINFVIVS